MPLHARDKIHAKLDDSIFGSKDASVVMPKYKFPRGRNPRRRCLRGAVRDELFLDGNARQNLATFCQTWEEPQIHALMDLSIDKNMIDKDEYPQTSRTRTALRPHAGRPVEFA